MHSHRYTLQQLKNNEVGPVTLDGDKDPEWLDADGGKRRLFRELAF